MQITEDQAICVLFYKSYNKKNLKLCRERLDLLGRDFKVCYFHKDLGQPILVSRQRILGDPFNYRTYPKASTTLVDQVSDDEKDEEGDEEHESNLGKNLNIENDEDFNEAEISRDDKPQILLRDHYHLVEFCDIVFLTEKPSCPELYHSQSTYTVADVLEVLKRYTDLFDTTSLLSFISWCFIREPMLFKRRYSNFTDWDHASFPPLTTQTKLMLFKMKDEQLDETAKMLM